jgi:hypothetical protein
MAIEHPNKVLAHEPQEPFPKVFKTVFWLLFFYLAVIFVAVGSDFLVGGGH